MNWGRMFRCERGVAAVEFAIVSVVLMTLLIGGIDMGRTFYVKNQLSFLADQAARAVLVDPDVTDAALQATTWKIWQSHCGKKSNLLKTSKPSKRLSPV